MGAAFTEFKNKYAGAKQREYHIRINEDHFKYMCASLSLYYPELNQSWITSTDKIHFLFFLLERAVKKIDGTYVEYSPKQITEKNVPDNDLFK